MKKKGKKKEIKYALRFLTFSHPASLLDYAICNNQYLLFSLLDFFPLKKGLHIFILLMLASFGSILLQPDASMFNFFFVSARFWELAVGVIVALSDHTIIDYWMQLQFYMYKVEDILGLFACVGIGFAVVIFTDDTASEIPGWSLCLPVFCTAVLICISKNSFCARALSCSCLVCIIF